MSYTPKCENCKFSDIQYTIKDDETLEWHFEKPLMCSIHKNEVDDDGICETWKIEEGEEL